MNQLASLGIANAYANAHNIDKLTETLEQFKGKMVGMKEVFRKEERFCRVSKRKYEDTLSDYEKLQQEYQIVEEERDTLKLSNMNLSKEKGELENKIAEMETQKSTADQWVEQDEAKVAGLEYQKSSLEVLLKVENQKRIHITPLTKHALFLRNKIYQIQVQIMREVFKVKQVEDRLQEISATATEFKDKTQDVVEVIQG